jgi:nucleoside 2-deoxyribosyltransferase
MTQKHLRSCFVSAPFGFDAYPLAEALREKNISSSRLDKIELGRSIIDSILDEVKEADFVCAVLPSGYTPENVIFEIGFALGLKRPVLVLTEPEVKVPFELRNLAQATVRLNDKRALGKAVEALLPAIAKAPHHGRKPVTFPKLRTISRADADEIFARLSEPHKVSEANFQEIVTDLFQKAGVLAPSPSHSGRGDLSIWIDELEPVFGNPILVEVKAGRLRQSQIDDAYHFLSYHLIRSNLLLGIVVYWDIESRKFGIPSPTLPLVACFSVDELVDHLRLGTFTQALVNIRNRAAHGMVS